MLRDYDVRLAVWASRERFRAAMDFEDKAGREHQKIIEMERSATIRSNYLEALILSFEALKVPCMVTAYLGEDHIVAAIEHGWARDWRAHGWKNKKGRTVQNAEQWQRLLTAMGKHSARFIQVGQTGGEK